MASDEEIHRLVAQLRQALCEANRSRRAAWGARETAERFSDQATADQDTAENLKHSLMRALQEREDPMQTSTLIPANVSNIKGGKKSKGKKR